MKRSEMLENIATELICDDSRIPWDKALDLADDILARIEFSGMYPPTTEAGFEEWESENETK